MIRRSDRCRFSLGLVLLAISCGTLVPWNSSGGRADSESGPVDPGVRRDYPRDEKAFAKWLRANIVAGRTTRDEVIAIFGKDYVNLDRPSRDGVLAIEYSVWKLGIPYPADYLVFEFDDRRRILRCYGGSYAICGFCPHVFADDGRWRLEGKMLAGCVGRLREGADTLLLPRLRVSSGRLRVRLANLAPEVEYLDRVELGCVPLRDGEELDVDDSSRPFVWRPLRPVEVSDNRVALDASPATRVLVLEVRNTLAFETATRAHFLQGGPAPGRAELRVRFEDGGRRDVQPVGTKFLRRVILPVPAQARGVRVEASNPFWLVRRAWLGTGRPAGQSALWLRPPGAALLAERDGKRLCLRPGEGTEVVFSAPSAPTPPARWGYVLRMTGYYEFQRWDHRPHALPGSTSSGR